MKSEKDRRKRILQFLPEESVQPACSHVNEGCGGCLMQDKSYEHQVGAKELLLQDIYGRHVTVLPAISPLGYRNRMDFVAAFGKKGLRKRGKFAQVVDIHDCLLLPENARKVFTRVRELCKELPDYNYIRHEGFLRYTVLRTSHTTNEMMLIITTTTPDSERKEQVLALLNQLRDELHLTSVHWTVNDSKTDVSVGEPYQLLGAQCINDEIAGIACRVYPTTFFQANTVMASKLFSDAMKYVHGVVLDLYSGVGVLGLLASQQRAVTQVIGVEINGESVRSAQENARLNGVSTDTCRFVCSDAATFLKMHTEPFDTVICDPARPGLEKAVALLLQHAPKRIVYISCNPLSHKEDVSKLLDKYELTHLAAYDLFPQTPHVEILSVLDRKDS